jgi:UDP-glucose 4-epimerase
VSTILVTGGAGFVGSHLCDRLLAGGHKIVALDDLSHGRIANLVEARTYGERFTFYNMDIRAQGLRDLFEKHEPEVVMHLAAQMNVRVSVDDPMLDASINVMGLLNVLESATRAGVRKVVFTSSGGTIYGDPKRFPIKESVRRGAHPVSPYGISKQVGENYLTFYKDAHGLDWTALALANVYGPRQNPLGEAGVISVFAEKMLAGEQPFINGDGEQTRDYVFVDDVVHAFALAFDKGSGGLFNIGTGVETSVNQIFKLVASSARYKGKPEHLPAKEGEVLRSALDASLAGEKLGWKPWTHLEDGVAETVAFFRGESSPSR